MAKQFLNQVTSTFDKITLKTENFSFSMGRNGYSCSGEIAGQSFKNLADYVQKQPKGTLNVEIFNALTDPKLLNSLLVPVKKVNIGDKVTLVIKKTPTEVEVVRMDKKFFIVKLDNQLVKVQKSVIL